MDLVIISVYFGWFAGASSFLSPFSFATFAGFATFAFFSFLAGEAILWDSTDAGTTSASTSEISNCYQLLSITNACD